MCHDATPNLSSAELETLGGDPGDLELGVLLAMAAAAGEAEPALDEVHGLDAAHLGVEDLGLDLGATHRRSADLRRVVAADHQHLVEGDLAALVALEELDADDVALLDPVLLAAGLDHCVHRLNPLLAAGATASCRVPENR